MKPDEFLDTLGMIIYRRYDYLSQMANDSGISRGRLERIKSGPAIEKDIKLAFKGYCLQEAAKLDKAAEELRKIAENL